MKSHILVISQYFFPESFRINDICLELHARGHRVTVLTGKPNYPEGRFYPGYGFWKPKKETWNGIEILRVPMIPRGRTSKQLAANYLSFVISGCVRSLFLKDGPDFVFSYEVSPMTQVLVGKGYSRRKHIPHFVYVQDLWPDNLEVVGGVGNRSVLRYFDRMSRKIYEQSDVIFASSPSFVKTIQERMETGKDKVKYLPQYAEEAEPEAFSAGDLPDTDSFQVVFAGNIGKAQGLEILPQTAFLLKDEKVRFVIVGEGRARQDLEKEIRARGVSDRFLWLGRKDPREVPAYLKKCDMAFVSFSPDPLFEKTIPAKLQTYLSCAMPILAAAGGETRRIIEEADCGICCDSGDAAALAACIRQARTADLARMGQNARAYCDAHFSKQKIMDYLESFFSK